MKHSIIITLLSLTIVSVVGQQFRQGNLNQLQLSNAHSALLGAENSVLLNAGYKISLVEFNDAPQYGFAQLELPFKRQNFGAGVGVNYFSAGLLQQTQAQFGFSYHQQLGKSWWLDLGIQPSVYFTNINFNEIEGNSNDVSAQTQSNFRPTFDGNFGLALRWKNNATLAFTAHQIIGNHTNFEDSIGDFTTRLSNLQSYQLDAQYNWRVAENFHIQPVLGLQLYQGGAAQYNAGIIFNTYNAFSFGALYKHNQGVAGIVGFRAKDRINIHYAYDYGLASNNNQFNGHEILLTLIIGKNNDTTPKKSKNRKSNSKANALLQEQVDQLQSYNAQLADQLEALKAAQQAQNEVLQQIKSEQTSSAKVDTESSISERKEEKQDLPQMTNQSQVEVLKKEPSGDNTARFEPIQVKTNNFSETAQFNVAVAALNSIDDARNYQATLMRKMGWKTFLLPLNTGDGYLICTYATSSKFEAVEQVEAVKRALKNQPFSQGTPLLHTNY